MATALSFRLPNAGDDEIVLHLGFSTSPLHIVFSGEHFHFYSIAKLACGNMRLKSRYEGVECVGEVRKMAAIIESVSFDDVTDHERAFLNLNYRVFAP